MKLRWKILLGFLALVVIFLAWWLAAPSNALRHLEATRRSLRQQGFKIDLAEFDLSTPPEVRRRAAILGTTTRAALTNRARPGPLRTELPDLMTPVGKDAALVAWKSKKLKSYRSPDLWAELRESLNTNRARLNTVLDAALAGPIRFEPIGPGPNASLPYLADLKGLETTFATEMLLALHDGQKDFAWTNLLACTCLVTEYAPEPIEISHLVRFACAGIAFQTSWNALQSRDWSDAQLAELERRWEAVDFWGHLPETAAHSRADGAAVCQMERKQTLGSEISLKELLRSPRQGWYALQSYWRGARYRHQGSYEDERALLLHYRDRELELRRAVPCTTWSKMRELPGVTNLVPFTTKNSSRFGAMMNVRQLSSSFQRQGRGLLGRAAEAETWRRLLITAIALERCRIRHGSYPEALPNLIPEFLASPLVDFMNGKPLRYRRTDDGHFVLYSVGLDCIDDGGQMRLPRQRGAPYEMASDFGVQRDIDLVWPRPASEAETERFHQDERMAEKERMEKGEEEWAAHQWSHTARRQAKVEEILKSAPTTNNEPSWHGRRLSDVLSNEQASGTNKLS